MLEPPSSTRGLAFEQAVAQQVRAWQEREQHPGVQSIWARVTIAPLRSPVHHAAEFETLIVLKNGILLHLECKSGFVNARDLEVKASRLQQAGSQCARVVLVRPIDRYMSGEVDISRKTLQGFDALPFPFEGGAAVEWGSVSTPPESVLIKILKNVCQS